MLQDRGKLDEAEPLYRQVLEARRRVLGPEHPDTLTAMQQPGQCSRAGASWTRPSRSIARSWRPAAVVLGPEHPDTLMAMNNLARVLQGRGKLEEAEPLYRQVLEARRRVLGPEHPDTLTAMHNLARVL